MRGAMIFKIRVNVWWVISYARSRYHVVNEGTPFIPLLQCCEIIVSQKRNLEQETNVVLTMNNICEHLYELICIKRQDINNVYLRKKIAVSIIVDIDTFTKIIVSQCSEIS